MSRGARPQLIQSLFSTAAAGIPAAHYRRFAGYLAEGGVPVLTYDYRGIGKSKPLRLRGFAASVEDWAEFDCGGAIAWVRCRYPRAKLVGIAHSIGALLLGGAPNANELSHFVLVSSHTGYFGDYLPRYTAANGRPLAWRHASANPPIWVLSCPPTRAWR